MATTTKAIGLISGPGSSYVGTGVTVPSGGAVSILWLEGSYYYVSYGSTRGYILNSLVTLSGELVDTVTLSSSARWNRTSTSVTTYYGPGSSYTTAGSISGYEQVSYLGKKQDSYAFIEYSTSSGLKRAWVDADKLTDNNPNVTTTYIVYVTYDANGGSGAPSTQIFTSTSSTISCTLSYTVPTRSGYTFLGWSTSSTATSTSYYAGGTYSFVGTTSGATCALYAVWKKTTYYTVYVTYDANGGSGAPSTQIFTETSSTISCTLSYTVPTRSGYTFLGWSTSSTATTAFYYAGSTYSFTGSETGTTLALYAIWSKTITLSYDANGGSGAPSSESKTIYNATTSYKFTVSTTKPTRDGYAFSGWSLSSTATTASYYSGDSITLSDSDTLYAIWEKSGGTVYIYTDTDVGWQKYEAYVCTAVSDLGVPTWTRAEPKIYSGNEWKSVST